MVLPVSAQWGQDPGLAATTRAALIIVIIMRVMYERIEQTHASRGNASTASIKPTVLLRCTIYPEPPVRLALEVLPELSLGIAMLRLRDPHPIAYVGCSAPISTSNRHPRDGDSFPFTRDHSSALP